MLTLLVFIGIAFGVFFFCRKLVAIETRKKGLRYCFNICFFLLAITIFILGIFVVEKIGGSFPTYWKTTSQKEFLDCGIVIETQKARFFKWEHNLWGSPKKDGLISRDVCNPITQ